MDAKREYTFEIVAEDWKEKLTANYDLFIERAESWEKEIVKQKDPATQRAAGAVRDRYRFAAEGMLLALDALGYAFDGKKIVVKRGDAYGQTGSIKSQAADDPGGYRLGRHQ